MSHTASGSRQSLPPSPLRKEHAVLPFDYLVCSFPHTHFILSTGSLENFTTRVFIWPCDNVSQTPRQVAGTPRPPSPLRKVHGFSAFLRWSAFFHHSTRVRSLVRRAIRPVSGIILRAHYSASLTVPIDLWLGYYNNSCL